MCMYFSPFLQSSEFSPVSGISSYTSLEKHFFSVFLIILSGSGSCMLFYLGVLVSGWLVGIVY